MPNTTYNLLRSRTFWLLVVMSFLPVANAIVPTLPVGLQAGVEAVLGLIAMYTHSIAATNAGATN